MAKKADLGHADNYPYPSFLQAQPAFGLAYDIVTGAAPDLTLAEKVKTLHTVLSFGIGSIFPHSHTAAPEEAGADPGLSKLLDWGNQAGAKAATSSEGRMENLVSKLWTSIISLKPES